jgi:hypothetical protein
MKILFMIMAVLFSMHHCDVVYSATDIDELRYCGEPKRDASGDIYRSSRVRSAFQRIHPCPSTGLRIGPCAGWQVDHVIPLGCGGCDAVSNMQWLPESIKTAKGGKDGFERKIYGDPVLLLPGCSAPPLEVR